MSRKPCDYLNLCVDATLKKSFVSLEGPEDILFSDHVTKINRKDKSQHRILVVTCHGLYNIAGGIVKRRIDVKTIDGLTVSGLSDEFVIHVPSEYDYRFIGTRKSDAVEAIIHSAHLLGVTVPIQLSLSPSLKIITTTRLAPAARRWVPGLVNNESASAALSGGATLEAMHKAITDLAPVSGRDIGTRDASKLDVAYINKQRAALAAAFSRVVALQEASLTDDVEGIRNSQSRIYGVLSTSESASTRIIATSAEAVHSPALGMLDRFLHHSRSITARSSFSFGHHKEAENKAGPSENSEVELAKQLLRRHSMGSPDSGPAPEPALRLASAGTRMVSHLIGADEKDPTPAHNVKADSLHQLRSSLATAQSNIKSAAGPKPIALVTIGAGETKRKISDVAYQQNPMMGGYVVSRQHPVSVVEKPLAPRRLHSDSTSSSNSAHSPRTAKAEAMLGTFFKDRVSGRRSKSKRHRKLSISLSSAAPTTSAPKLRIKSASTKSTVAPVVEPVRAMPEPQAAESLDSPSNELLGHASLLAQILESTGDEVPVHLPPEVDNMETDVESPSVAVSHPPVLCLAPISRKASDQPVSLESFELLRVLGKGSYGKVSRPVVACVALGFLGTQSGMQVLLVRKKDTAEVFAMKVLNKKTVVAKRQVEHTQTERAILESMDHPFLIKLRYAFQSRMNLYLVMPYVAGGELFQRLRVHRLLPEEWVQFYAAEIALGIGHLHACGIVFRDLKPENVLIDRDGHVILSDFGLAKILDSDDDMTNTFCGTPEYIAPEMLDGKPHSYAVDWYAFGLLVWELLAGLPPFAAPTGNVSDVYDAIRRGPPPFPRHFSDGVRALLTDLLQMDPIMRLGARSFDADVEAIKKHPFFAAVDWDLLLTRKVTPPWIPPTRELTDTSNFDTEFTSLPIVGSIDNTHGVTGVSHTSGKSIASGASLPQFEGFSYGSMGSCLATSGPGMSPALPSSILAGTSL